MSKRIAYILQFVSHNRLNLNDADLNLLIDGQSVYNVECSSRKYKGSSSGEAPLQYLLDRAWREFGDTSMDFLKFFFQICILLFILMFLFMG